MIDSLLINKTLVFVISIITLGFATWVYFANSKEKLNRVFSLMTILIFFWIVFGYLTTSSLVVKEALFWAKLAYASVSLFYIPFYFFFVLFLKLEKQFKNFSKLVVGIGVSLSVLAISTDLIVEGAKVEEWGVDLIFGKGSIFFYGMAITLSLLVIYLLFKKYFDYSKEKRVKIQYFLVGIVSWILINFVFNMILPIWQKSIRYSLLGNYSAIFLLAFTGYAIVKRRLFGIKVVLSTILTSLIAVLLLFDIFVLTESVLAKLFKALLLVIFLYFAYLLIKSVLDEIKYREKLQQAYRDLKKLDQAKSEFLSIASHQLRTPLTAIKGYISMVLEGSYGKLPEKTIKPIENVYQSNQRLIKLVNDFLNVSRIETGKMKLKLEKVVFESMIDDIVQEFENEASKKNIYLKYEKPKKSLPKISIDKNKMRQVILNIIDNGIRYTQKGGITIKTNIEKSKLKITIIDTGQGIIKEDLFKMFESFSRGTTGNRFYTEGVGMGLYVSKKFVEMHNGKIWAESEGVGKGSVFYILLPIK